MTGPLRTSAFVYPWDVVGDPHAAERIAALGVEQVTLASAYHSARALTPRHPRHRIVTARHAAVLYPPGARWKGRPLAPYRQDWVPGEDPYGEAAQALTRAGLEVHSWVVLAHNSRLGDEHPHTSVVNAYGDRYPWAPCIARPEVREYLVDLAAEAAVRPGTQGTELESLGWYGLAHLHAHDKIAGVGLGGAARYLMSLCFCTVCREEYGGLGPQAVRAALEPVFAHGDAGDGWADVERLLGAGQAAATVRWRSLVARELQEACIDAVRVAAEPGFQVLLHADPSGAHRCGADAAVDPAHILGEADGLVLPCTGDAAAREAVLAPCAPHRRETSVLAANFSVVSGMGGRPQTLAEDAAHARSLGATELRLYHAGLASDADLEHVREALGS